MLGLHLDFLVWAVTTRPNSWVPAIWAKSFPVQQKIQLSFILHLGKVAYKPLKFPKWWECVCYSWWALIVYANEVTRGGPLDTLC